MAANAHKVVAYTVHINMFEPSFFVNNRNKLRELLNGQPALIAGNGQLQRKRDTVYPFAQDSNFWYLSGVNEADCVLYIAREQSDDCLLVAKRSHIQSVFDGEVSFQKISDQSGITKVFEFPGGLKMLAENYLQNDTKLFMLKSSPLFSESSRMYINPARKRLEGIVRRRFNNLSIENIEPYIAKLRVVKQPVEIEAIKNAVKATATGFRAVAEELNKQKVQNERQLELLLGKCFLDAGAAGHAYSPIIAGGANATTLHYINNNQTIADHSLIVIDAGAEYCGYAADVTRTFAFNTPSERQKSIYDSVTLIQSEALKLFKPGLNFRDLEVKVRELVGDELMKLNLTNKKYDKQAISRYFPHSTSHFLGLDVHDVGDYKQPLAEGMVITCEPGIYIPEEGIGVRIEDDILITKNGYDNLTSSISKSLS